MINRAASRLARPRSAMKPAMIVVLVLTIISVVFLLLGHRVERAQDLKTIAESEDNNAINRAVLLTCKNMNNRVLLASRMKAWSLERRLRITATAESLGCIDGIGASYRAEHYLYSAPKSHPSMVITQHAQAIEPAIVALESKRPEVVLRAQRSLLGLSTHINEDQRRRILRRLLAKSPTVLVQALRKTLGGLEPAVETPTLTKPPMPKKTAEAATPPVPRDTPATDVPLKFELGKGLRLNLDGLNAPQPLTIPKLGTSVPVPKNGVLFRAKTQAPNTRTPKTESP